MVNKDEYISEVSIFYLPDPDFQRPEVGWYRSGYKALPRCLRAASRLKTSWRSRHLPVRLTPEDMMELHYIT